MAHFALGGYCIVVYKNTEQRALRHQIENDLRMKLENAGLDEIQDWMSCCGILQPAEEYRFVDATKLNGYELPPSCCESRVPCSIDSPDRYSEGCLTSVFDFTVGTNIIIGYISLGIAATELLGAIFAICLSCCVWRHQSVAVWR
nr:CD63 antigen-like [Leptinotarsa decemlineata]